MPKNIIKSLGLPSDEGRVGRGVEKVIIYQHLPLPVQSPRRLELD